MREITLFEKELSETPIQALSDSYGENTIYMKREDAIPFSFGGNKARKAAEFYSEIKNANADVIMTYGSNSSNHCRIIANMAAGMGLACHVISPSEQKELLNNTRMVKSFGAVIETCPVTEVAKTIEYRKEDYRAEGKTPYFIAGGGHGNPGTESYIKAYREIVQQEKKSGLYFDYIFHASGTGTTQAGLVCGQLMSGDLKRKIVGISIAREGERGRDVVKSSICEYLGEEFEKLYREDALLFVDDYRLGGYGNYTEEVEKTIDFVLEREGIPLDTTYVGKAFYGMLGYLKKEQICGKRILFIHTGGTPLFFDKLMKNNMRID